MQSTSKSGLLDADQGISEQEFLQAIDELVSKELVHQNEVGFIKANGGHHGKPKYESLLKVHPTDSRNAQLSPRHC